MSVQVRLNKFEAHIAVEIAGSNQINAMSSGMKSTAGMNPKYEWENHINGTMGEMAACKALNIYYEPRVNGFKNPDCGTDIQVRYSNKETTGLIIRPGDNPDHRYVHVTGSFSDGFTVHGYIKGSEAMKQEFVCSPDPKRPPCWMVPHQRLLDIKEMRP